MSTHHGDMEMVLAPFVHFSGSYRGDGRKLQFMTCDRYSIGAFLIATGTHPSFISNAKFLVTVLVDGFLEFCFVAEIRNPLSTHRCCWTLSEMKVFLMENSYSWTQKYTRTVNLSMYVRFSKWDIHNYGSAQTHSRDNDDTQ